MNPCNMPARNRHTACSEETFSRPFRTIAAKGSVAPTSPVTTSYFAAWMVLDAKDRLSGTTLGDTVTAK